MIRHGVKKTESPKVSEEANNIEKIIGMNNCVEKHSKMVLLNPDDYNSWNYLKERVFSAADPIQEIEAQMDLSQRALQVNPKSYAAWFHRYFLFTRWKDMWFKEHQLCTLLLKFDPRNFHCWNYCLKNGFKIKEDLHNSTSMHFAPYHSRNLFIDPSDEGLWNTFDKRREQEVKGYKGLIRRYKDFSEIIFEKNFSGDIQVNGEWFNQVFETRRLVFNKEILSILIDKKDLSIVLEEIPTVLTEILSLDSQCIHALRRKMMYLTGKERREISEKLQMIDPIRQKYYQWLESKEYRTFLLIDK